MPIPQISHSRKEQFLWALRNTAYSSLRTHHEFWDFKKENPDFVPAISIIQQFTERRGLCFLLSKIVSPLEQLPHLRPRENEGRTIDEINESNERKVIRRQDDYVQRAMVAVFTRGGLSLRFCEVKGRGSSPSDLIKASRLPESNNTELPLLMKEFLQSVIHSPDGKATPKWIRDIAAREFNILQIV